MKSDKNIAQQPTEKEILFLLKDFSKNIELDYPPNGKIRKASVLVPMLWEDNQWHLLFTKRTDKLHFHKSQVSFPGGVEDPGDVNPRMTAIRESNEEISLKPDFVKVLGCLPAFTSLTNYLITPVVGHINWPIELLPNPDEVQKIFTIPLSWLADTINREWRTFQATDGRTNQVIYYKPYKGEILWGITAKITVTLLSALKYKK